jgi:serine/threonine protein kinase/tetratricopeptide (TPR) repeat protein
MATDPLIGSTVGGCMILEVIGQGGMGVIYKARQKSLDRVVALKVLAPHLANDANFVGRFQREARAIARVNHPNILAVYDVGDDQNTNYMIMELIDGQSLAEVQTERQGALPWEEAANFILQAAQGLEAAQASGIIHRDIKPENLMLTKKGVIKVSDFGLAKDADSTTTSTDAVMGTPAFMSPEQCDGKKVDGRSDIYSLGGTFYRLITGRLPFEAETAMSMMYRHKHEALIPPHEVVPTLPVGISAVIGKMMAKKREQRQQTMTEVIDAIDQARNAVAAAIASVAVPPSGPKMKLEGAKQISTHHPAPPPGPDLPPAGDAPPPPAEPFSSGESGFHKREGPANFGGGAKPVSARAPAQPAPPQSGRLPVTTIPPGGFQPSSTSHMTLPSGVLNTTTGLAIPDDGYTAVASGDEHLARGDRVSAMKAYRQALQSRSLDNSTRARVEQEVRKEVTTRRAAAENLLKKGMLVEASRECRILVEIDPSDESMKAMAKDLDTRLSQKRTLENDIRTAIASSHFEKAIKAWDNASPELRSDALGKQIEQLRTVVVPSFKLAEQGESFSKQGRLEEAISTFEDSLKINPTCEAARIGLGDARQKVARIDHMLKEGYQFSLEQNYAKAVETWKPILALRPGHPQTVKSMVDAYVAHAQYLRSQGDLEGALAAYKGAAETDPQNRTVRRTLEDLTNLFDKEQALLDRASEAIARGRMGQAIGYWKDIQRLNPANKKAAQQIAMLSRQRSGGFFSKIAVLLVLAAGGGAAYQFYIEKQALGRTDGLISEATVEKDRVMGKRKLEEAIELLKSTRIIFFKDDAQHRVEDASQLLDELQAQQAGEEGNYQEQVDRLRALAIKIRPRSAAKADHYERMALLAEIKRLNLLSNALMVKAVQDRASTDDSRWNEACSHFADISSQIAARPKQDEELSAQRDAADKKVGFITTLLMGLQQEKMGRSRLAQDQFKNAEKQIDVVKVEIPEIEQYLKAHLARLGIDDEKNKKVMTQALADLKKTADDGSHPDLVKAIVGFKQLVQGGASEAERARELQQYAEDIASCEKPEKNMRLVTGDDPLRGGSWGAHERKLAFCIDRFEYPNTQDKLPRVNVTLLDAKNECDRQDKILCPKNDWELACRGSAGWQFPYGPSYVASTCNTESKAPVPSGSKPACKSAIGVYDMSGNVAEWVMDDTLNALDNLGTIQGGSYHSGNDSECQSSSQQLKKNEGFKDVGFRCCRKLDRQD